MHGSGGAYVGDTPAIVLDDGTVIPAIHEHDGPQGVANGNKDVTCWPAALTVVQTWDEDLMYQYGAGMGREQYLKGSNVVSGDSAASVQPHSAGAALPAAAKRQAGRLVSACLATPGPIVHPLDQRTGGNSQHANHPAGPTLALRP